MHPSLTLALCAALAIGAAQSEDPPPSKSKSARAIDYAKERTWWSYAPLATGGPPTLSNEASSENWCKNEIDQFVLAKLEERGLAPAPQASPTALVRRAYYDLTGLPPTPEEIDAFVSDTGAQVWEHLIERLLNSPHYGERWGRHWLDLVRYADTNGFERDGDKPAAWRYRDWVIAAFNSDKPYDRFLVEQLAGDELPDRSFDTMIATGYYRLGMWDDEVPDLQQAQYDDLDGIVDTTARTMLGMGLGCARCHDHKGDPITQRDYYSFAAFFAGLKPYKTATGNSLEAANVTRVITPEFGTTNGESKRDEWKTRRKQLIDELLAIELSAGNISVPIDRAPSDGLAAHYTFETIATAPEIERASLTSTVDSAHGQVVDLRWGENGRFGYGGTFDGGDDRILIPRTIGDDFTISLWMKTDRVGPGSDSDPRWFTGAGLVDGEVPGIVDDFGISIVGSGIIAAGVGNPETFLNSSPGFNDGEWHHIALTRSKSTGTVALIVDGIESMRAVGGRQTLSAAKQLVIGGMHPGGGPFTGAIDEVRIYDRVLTAPEVLSIATGVGSPTEYSTNAYQALAQLKSPQWSGSTILCAGERDDPVAMHVLTRGSPHAPAEEVQPAVPAIAATIAVGESTEVFKSESSGRRLALAKWITDPNNPHTARAMVNRIWQHHFSRAICPTPNDFGHFGELPTHPELLDWLAQRFIASGWSMKEMHKLIMSSATYQMSSVPSVDALAKDAPNDLLSRFRLRRLQSEEIRDSLLAVNGTLNDQMGGPGFRPPVPSEVLATSSKPNEVWPLTEPASWPRRSIYIHAKRSLLLPLLAIFDQADIDNACPVRFSTVQPTQALTMLNGALTNDAARTLADRVRLEFPADVRSQVLRAMRLAYGRSVDAKEVEEGVAFVHELQLAESMSESDAMNILALALVNSNEFSHVD